MSAFVIPSEIQRAAQRAIDAGETGWLAQISALAGSSNVAVDLSLRLDAIEMLRPHIRGKSHNFTLGYDPNDRAHVCVIVGGRRWGRTERARADSGRRGTKLLLAWPAYESGAFRLRADGSDRMNRGDEFSVEVDFVSTVAEPTLAADKVRRIAVFAKQFHKASRVYISTTEEPAADVTVEIIRCQPPRGHRELVPLKASRLPDVPGFSVE
jgi:hypothetical protein